MLGVAPGELALRSRPPDPAAAALMARMSAAPDAARVSLIDATVRALKAGGVWAKLDCCWVTAAHEAQAARLNWVTAGNDLSAIGAPGFLADRGYQGDGATSCLDTGFVPGSGQTLRDSHHLSVLSLDAGQWGVAEIGADMLSITGRTPSDVMGTRSASEAVLAIANSDGSGLLAISRGSGVGYRWYRNGATLDDAVQPSSAFGGVHSLYLCGRNASGTPASNNKRLAAATVGGALSDAEQAALHQALAKYLAALGAA